MMWRRALAAIPALILATLPNVALAFGEARPEPNWKIWAAAMVVTLLISPLIAWALYGVWFLPKMRAGTAKRFGYLLGIYIPILTAVLTYIWFVGVVPDLLFYAAAAVGILLLILAAINSTRRPV